MSIIDRRHVLVGLSASGREEALRKVADLLRSTDCVKESFTDAVLAREEVYPTGLNLKYNAIAMPHTDPQHVNRPGIALVKLDKSVEFWHMGGSGELVQAEMIFMMAITDPEEQINNLKKVMQVFLDADLVEKFRNARDADELYALGKQYFE